jgi:hypothetical protein
MKKSSLMSPPSSGTASRSGIGKVQPNKFAAVKKTTSLAKDDDYDNDDFEE